jgi:cell division protein ZapA (FtsZ GTPase activity inhibitor)
MIELTEGPFAKGAVKTTEISLGGVKVRVRTDSTPASLKQIRDLVDTRYEEFADKLNKGVSAHQLMVLVAFNLAEELLKEKERNRALKKTTAEWTERWVNRVEAHLDRST